MQRPRVGRRAAAAGARALSRVGLQGLALGARRRDVNLIARACRYSNAAGKRLLDAAPCKDNQHERDGGGSSHRRFSRPWRKTFARGCVFARQSWCQCALRAARHTTVNTCLLGLQAP